MQRADGSIVLVVNQDDDRNVLSIEKQQSTFCFLCGSKDKKRK